MTSARELRVQTFVAVTGLVAALGCGGPGGDLPPLPEKPVLDAMEAPIRAAYDERRAALDAAVAGEATAVERAQTYGALGQWFHAQRVYGGAVVAYQGARVLDPGDGRWPYYLAHVYRVTGERELAAAMLRQTLELAADHLPATVLLAETDWEAGRHEAAAEGFERALRIDSRCVRALAGRAKVELARGDPDAAIGTLVKALGLQPDAAALRYQLGMAYRQAGDAERAAAELAAVPQDNEQQARLALGDPWMDEVTALRGRVSSEQLMGRRALAAGRPAIAAEHFRRAIEAEPDSIEARINLALALQGSGRFADAEAAARDAVSRAPTYARARVALAGALVRQQRQAEARLELEAAVEADPAHEVARANLAHLLRREGRLEEALPHFARVRQLDVRMTAASWGYAVTLVDLGRFAAAASALEEDLRQQPGNRMLRLLLARLLAAAPEASLRDGARALELAREAARAGATLTDAETLAMALAELGRFAEAVGWQTAALRAAASRGASASPDLERRLESYRGGEPCRDPWVLGEVPSALAVVAPIGDAN